MIYEVKMYAAKCDNCGREAFDNQDYSCYGDKEQVREIISEMGWHETDYKNPLTSKHYCPECFTHDDNDNLVIQKRKQPYYEG